MSDAELFELRPLTPEAIPRALARADQFRLLNEGREAESICRDVLRIDPENQEALIKLLLAVTDQFREGQTTIAQARRILPKLHDEYEKAYFTGVIYERWAKAHHKSGVPDTVTSEYFLEAMRAFEKAIELRPAGNDDAVLRWNSCVRLIRADEYLQHKFQRFSLYDETPDST